MSADLDARIERMERDVRLREKYLDTARQALALLEAEREALAQAYPATMVTAADIDGDYATISDGVARASLVVVRRDRVSTTHITPADARRMAVWLAAFAEEHGA